jgi:hypothetical protein
VSTAHEIGDDAALVPAVVVVLPAVDVFGAEAEHAVDEARELMGSGGDGLGGAEAGFQSAVEGPADLLWYRELAARRSAAATRLAERLVRPLSFLPPETLLPGERLSQEAKCFSVGHRVMSSPISATTLRAVGASMPSIRVRSTPVRR